jgi:hypothetical protein
MKAMIEIVPFTPEYTDDVVSVILPIQKSEFNVPVTLGTKPDDLKDIPGFYQRDDGHSV